MFTYFKKVYNFSKKKYRKLLAKRYGIKDPILVYQMGKVGSTTVYQSLKDLELEVSIYHIHLLNNLDEIETSIRRNYSNPKETLAEIEKGRKLRKKILSGQFEKVNIISLVREPVKRNIAAFFQNINEVIPDYKKRYQNNSLTVDDMVKIFLNQYDHNGPLNWFDSQLKDVFNIDVFSSNFPKDLGYKIYRENKMNLLLVRLENLNICIKNAMKEFLGIKNFELVSANIGSKKPYSTLYKQFLSNVILPQDYLDKMYNSKFAQQFYTSDEIEKFRKHWSRERKISDFIS